MKPGETGVVVKIEGGIGASRRIQAMGLRVGKEVKKIASHFRRGPQSVITGKSKIAIGFGMASRIFVETQEK